MDTNMDKDVPTDTTHVVKENSAEAATLPPVKPARPTNPHVATLKAAFPDVDDQVISAVLIASRNNLEPAFDALLGMSDPDFKPEMPARPSDPKDRSQIDNDELLARQLAQEGAHSSRQKSRRSRNDRSENDVSYSRQGVEEKEHNFMDDDLPIIRENIIQGFNETKSKVNTWVSTFSNNLRQTYQQRMNDGGNDSVGTRSKDSPTSSTQNRGSRQSHRTSMGNESFDPDPAPLDDDFSHLEIQDNSASPHLTGHADSSQRETKWQPIQSFETSSKKDEFSIGESDDEEGTNELLQGSSGKSQAS